MKIVKERRKQTSENPGTAAEAPEAPEAHVRRFVTVINVYKHLESVLLYICTCGRGDLDNLLQTEQSKKVKKSTQINKNKTKQINK